MPIRRVMRINSFITLTLTNHKEIARKILISIACLIGKFSLLLLAAKPFKNILWHKKSLHG